MIKALSTIFLLCCTVFCSLLQNANSDDSSKKTEKPQIFRFGSRNPDSDDSSKKTEIFWIIKAGELEKTSYTTRSPYEYYHETASHLLDKSAVSPIKGEPTPPNINGLKIDDYYIVYRKDEQKDESCWWAYDSAGIVCWKIDICYAEDRTHLLSIACYGDYDSPVSSFPKDQITTTDEEGFWTCGQKDEMGKLKYIYFMEYKGFILTYHHYDSRISLTEETKMKWMRGILKTLAGDQAPLIRLDEINAILKKKKDKEDEEARLQARWGKEWEPSRKADYHMPVGAKFYVNRAVNAICLAGALNIEAQYYSTNSCQTIPNMIRGVGIGSWLKKHINIPYVKEYPDKEPSENGEGNGYFMITRPDGAPPVKIYYIVAHLQSQRQALQYMLTAHYKNKTSNETFQWYQAQELAQRTQIFPKLVGDLDLCLKPVRNDLGAFVPHSAYSTVSFVRGNSVVRLESDCMTYSVLPLAKMLDEKFKQAIEQAMEDSKKNPDKYTGPFIPTDNN